MHPVAHERLARRAFALRDLVGVMDLNMVHATAVDIEGLAEVGHAHGGAFYVPARIPGPPRTVPLHDVFGLVQEPEREVVGMPLLTQQLHAPTGARLLDRK